MTPHNVSPDPVTPAIEIVEMHAPEPEPQVQLDVIGSDVVVTISSSLLAKAQPAQPVESIEMTQTAQPQAAQLEKV